MNTLNFQDPPKSYLKETHAVRQQKWTGEIHEKSIEKRHKKQIIMLRGTIIKGISINFTNVNKLITS